MGSHLLTGATPLPTHSKRPNTIPTVGRAPFGVAPDGTAVELFTLRAAAVELRVMTYGCTIVELRTPDRHGRPDNIVLGHDALDGYLRASPYFGAVVGRCCNRIARGRFTLDGVGYQLATNDGVEHLHGGVRGFDKVNWTPEPFESAGGSGVSFAHVSAHGDEGYPGTLHAEVRYTLAHSGALTVDYGATTDRPTIVNLTQHSYFNLGGPATADVLGHVVTINADAYTPIDAHLIPTGAIATVAGTPLDFRTPASLGARIADPYDQLRLADGYDHNFVLRRPDTRSLVHAASVSDPSTSRTLDVHTTEPGLQLYSGNRLDGTICGRGGRVYGNRSGLCLETQHFPDSPNRPAFPSVVLRPGEQYASRTVYAFGVQS